MLLFSWQLQDKTSINYSLRKYYDLQIHNVCTLNLKFGWDIYDTSHRWQKKINKCLFVIQEPSFGILVGIQVFPSCPQLYPFLSIIVLPRLLIHFMLTRKEELQGQSQAPLKCLRQVTTVLQYLFCMSIAFLLHEYLHEYMPHEYYISPWCRPSSKERCKVASAEVKATSACLSVYLLIYNQRDRMIWERKALWNGMYPPFWGKSFTLYIFT